MPDEDEIRDVDIEEIYIYDDQIIIYTTDGEQIVTTEDK